MPSSLDMSGRSFFGRLAMSRDPGLDLRIEEARSFGDYLFLRTLRNQVRHVMTNDTSYIGYLGQLKFYVAARCKFKRMRAFKVFIARCRSRPVGYLLIRTTQDGALVTTAIDGRFRRQGIGKKLVNFAQRSYGDLVAEIRDDNAASIALHESMGFQREARRDGILVYRFRRQ